MEKSKIKMERFKDASFQDLTSGDIPEGPQPYNMIRLSGNNFSIELLSGTEPFNNLYDKLFVLYCLLTDETFQDLHKQAVLKQIKKNQEKSL